jgi:hypothetical protein
MRARIRREWLQKHPTPRAGDGDFHWYPAAADPALLSEIAAGAAGDLTLWLEPGRVVCARRFTEIAPADGRRYTGIAAAIAEHPSASAAALLAAIPVPDAAPWTSAPVDPIDAPLSAHPPTLPAAIAAIENRRVVVGPPAAAAPSPAPITARPATPPAPRSLSPFLLAALAVSLLTNLLLAVAFLLRDPVPQPALDAPDPAPPPAPAPAAIPAPIDAGVVDAPPPDAAPPDAAPEPKPKPAPPRKRRK